MNLGRALACGVLLAVLGCAHRVAPHSFAEPPELQWSANTAPPDFSRDANVTIVAKNGSAVETSIAISRVDPQLATLAVIDRSAAPTRITIYRSTDGGVTWSDGQPQTLTSRGRTYTRGADPVLVADSDGSFYLAELLVDESVALFGCSVVAVSRSTDGGRTWSEPNVIVDRPADATPQQFDDKEWLSVDAETGRLTVAWSFFLVNGNTPVGSPIVYVSQSTDHGTTWSTPKAIRSADLQLTQVVAANGVTYLSYVDFTANSYPVRVATQGSDNFGDEVTAVTDRDAGGWILPNTSTLSVTTHSMAVDLSPGPYRGTVYLVAPERKDVLFTRSTDGGKSWSAPKRLGGRGDILFPAVAVDPVNGDVVVSWLDRRDDPKNVMARVYAARSTDGGDDFTAEQPFSSPFTLGRKMGDYDSCAVSGGHALRAFTTDGGFASVARIDFPTPPPRRRAVGH